MKKISDGLRLTALADGLKALAEHPTMDYALVYPLGFVANSYRYPAPAERLRVNRDGTHRIETYDRKRSNGNGKYITLWNNPAEGTPDDH